MQILSALNLDEIKQALVTSGEQTDPSDVVASAFVRLDQLGNYVYVIAYNNYETGKLDSGFIYVRRSHMLSRFAGHIVASF